MLNVFYNLYFLNSLNAAPIDSNVCYPSPCGPNSQCREINGQAVCSCVQDYVGSPPMCRPECVQSSECPLNQACFNQKCRDPCAGTCGIGAMCTVVTHNPICSCPSRFTGNPFTRCQPIGNSLLSVLKKISKYNYILVERPADPINPCQPSPCGAYSECRPVGDSSSCSCLRDYIGSPPNCKPECVSNAECSNHLACINQKCKDPCPGLCGVNAECRVISHSAVCTCITGFIGDPFTQCRVLQTLVMDFLNPCHPNPCGSNAVCRENNGAGSCQCIVEYIGNPYEGCRPECTISSDCPSNRACVNSKCNDPCSGTCAQNAQCQVVNHQALCTCHNGFTGDPYRICKFVSNDRKYFYLKKTKIDEYK